MSAVCSEFVDTLVSFLEACLHHLLCLRGVYPSSFFRRVRLFGQFVWWSHAKAVSSYIRELCLSLRESLRRRLLPSIRLAILDRNDALLEWFDFRFSSGSASAVFLSPPCFFVGLPGGQRDGEEGERHSARPAAAKSRELGFSEGDRTEKYVLQQDVKTGGKLENAQRGDTDRHRRRRRCRDFMETTHEVCSDTRDDEDSERAKISRETRLAYDRTRQENVFAEGRDQTGKKDAVFSFPSVPATLVDHCRDTLNRLEFSSFWIDDLCEDSDKEEEGGRKTSDGAPRTRHVEIQKAARSTSPGIRRVRGRRKACTFRVLVEVDQTVLSRFEARKNAASCSRSVPLAADEDLHAIQRLPSDEEEAVNKTEMERKDTRKKSDEAEEQRTGVVTDPWIAAAELVGFPREDRQ
ncbi:UNVERIFIED_CONTAM: hypothetical protein HHA_244010 [Hammondia hammondi]|eukprot:XP_008884303.1 hypothetical protein HHA_244010 [Hammondia hammondi]